MEEKILLIDAQDKVVGTCEKMEVHRQGYLHRAFSIFLFNHRGEMLLQQRAREKYHSGGLWTNTCCSHQNADESAETTVHRRLKEEMISTSLKFLFKFIYRTTLNNSFIEYEFDHIYVGSYNGIPKPNPLEVQQWEYFSVENIQLQTSKKPHKFTEWFKIIIKQHIENLEEFLQFKR